jgi:hypothetical protein
MPSLRRGSLLATLNGSIDSQITSLVQLRRTGAGEEAAESTDQKSKQQEKDLEGSRRN